MHKRILITRLQQITSVNCVDVNLTKCYHYWAKDIKILYLLNRFFKEGETENVKLCRKSH